jgi:UDP-N-acetyl-2-amino-2-deoxyglucuronate dehydrogenase
MADRVIGVGLIGCGNIGQIHAASLSALAADGEAIRPVLAADASEECRDDAGSNWAFERVVSDPAELIADPAVDAVFICTPTATHRDLILAALAAGKHLYTEKPLAPSLAIVKEICSAVSAAPVVAQVGFQMRWNAMHAKVKKLVESGELGRPMSYLVRDDEAWPTTAVSSFASDWRSQKKYSGGGPLIEHSIHAIDLVSWMFGPARRVSAATNSVFGFDVEDAAGLVLEHESGVIGTLMTLYGGVQGREQSRFEVFFERGVVEITWGVLVNTDDNSFRLEQSGEEPVLVPPEEILEQHLADLGGCAMPNFWNELASRAFFAAIRAGRPASPGIRDALIAHATVEAAYRSAREKRSVELRELID